MSLSTSSSSSCCCPTTQDNNVDWRLDKEDQRTTGTTNTPQPPQHDWLLDDTLATLASQAGYTCLLGPKLDEHYPIEWKTGDLAWVLKSKGQRRGKGVVKDDSGRGGKRLELFLRGRIIDNPHAAGASDEQETCLSNTPRDVVPTSLATETNENSNESSSSSPQRLWIQYPKGSTYHVKRDRLLRILPRHQGGLILTWPETDVYRRSCLTHTLPDGEGFCEIGCDHGPTIHRVASWLATTTTDVVLGIDKADDSIASARQRYPQYTFCQWDCLQPDAVLPAELESLIQNNKSFHLAIDIGGNRDLPAVLQCLRVLLVDFALRPRLVFVKSRALFQELSRRETDRQDGF